MAEKRKVDFCIGCRKNTEYEIQKGIYKETIRDREYEFVLTEAICKECGEKMHIPGLIDANIREREEQYYGSCCKISGKMPGRHSLYTGEEAGSNAFGFTEASLLYPRNLYGAF